MLDYERRDGYRCAVEHLAFVCKTIPQLPRGFAAALGDPWRRAATSISMNIAEAGLLDVVDTAELDRSKVLIVRIVEMLSKLCH